MMHIWVFRRYSDGDVRLACIAVGWRQALSRVRALRSRGQYAKVWTDRRV